MPLQNRVMPWGSIIAHSARGTLTGNRGILHDDQRQLGAARWRHKAWICCTLAWKDTRRVPMTPGTWTELFFLDEAVAFAAGHRPCALCRRAAYNRFAAAWAAAGLPGQRAGEIDAVLHKARVTPRLRSQITHLTRAADLPDGAMIAHDDTAGLILGSALLPFRPDGYAASVQRPTGEVTVLTPAPLVAVLRHGYIPQLHPSATVP